jgi:hypothetical protein
VVFGVVEGDVLSEVVGGSFRGGEFGHVLGRTISMAGSK